MTIELKFDPSLIYMEYGHFLFFNIYHKQNITWTYMYPALFYLLYTVPLYVRYRKVHIIHVTVLITKL